mmetsp:Transcript_20432/g.3321  ORF Transcript_20432/g.3321 Transcript_20432/m.3321 type:complete len:154 (-) Transcript_20432:271-732(-)
MPIIIMRVNTSPTVSFITAYFCKCSTNSLTPAACHMSTCVIFHSFNPALRIRTRHCCPIFHSLIPLNFQVFKFSTFKMLRSCYFNLQVLLIIPLVPFLSNWHFIITYITTHLTTARTLTEEPTHIVHFRPNFKVLAERAFFCHFIITYDKLLH